MKSVPNKVKPIRVVKSLKKRTKRFLRHHSDRYLRLSRSSWRKPKGIDSCVRRRFKGAIPMPNIGYGTSKKTRHIAPDGFIRFRVFNASELELLLMHNRRYSVVIAKSVAARKRKEIVERADQLGLKVVNREAKLKAEEHE